MIGICTDSTSQLPRSLAARFGIEVVPVTVTIDGRHHLDGVDLDADRFYAHFDDGRRPEISTAPPPPARFTEAYRRLADRGCTHAVSIHVTASLSATLTVAAIGAEQSPIPVELVDSGTAGFGTSCCVWAAALAAEAGGTIEEVVTAVGRVGPLVTSSFVVGTPEVAEAGGRTPSLDLRSDGIPVLTMDGGEVSVLARVATVGAAVVAMADHALDRSDPVNVAIGTSDASSAPVADALEEALRRRDQVVDIIRFRIGPSVGAHTGPGTTGLFVFPAI